MMAQHGWKARPSPRRGFTVVEASRELAEAPVVMAVHDSAKGIRLFRTALDEAMNRGCDLVVLDYGETSLRDELQSGKAEPAAREKRDLRALWSNPHVQVVREQQSEADLERAVSYCELTNASLLILAADRIGSQTLGPELNRRLFHGDFDLLIVTDHAS